MRIHTARRTVLGVALALAFTFAVAAGPAAAQIPGLELAAPKPSISDVYAPKPAPSPRCSLMSG